MSVVISFRIEDEERDALKEIADRYDATISWAARRAIKQYLTNLTKENEDENNDDLYSQSNEAIGGERTHTDCDNTQP